MIVCERADRALVQTVGKNEDYKSLSLFLVSNFFTGNKPLAHCYVKKPSLLKSSEHLNVVYMTAYSTSAAACERVTGCIL